ncbi:hypothetical protein B0G62_10312 [Paraburkholderia eburnea]|uniref:Uncharacterized protein n=1 Tax=Paraburkholderia eburnea TaxID=1189126 RepID=A0A2S4MFC6_9BURK|nr:DUF6013 family protein [Paraburkholderia eburnea]POR53443.1 hypothetical protein B0G62_10312 [Paraburkholderia eburnea]PRZ25411.1 hypothetical protein BX588_10212 [Paraburkholderia eburnea]
MPCSRTRSRRTRAALAHVAVALSCAIALSAFAATPITVTSQAATDGPIRYTVKVTSKLYGTAQETRTLRSGDTDDFNWRSTPPGGAVPAAQSCPDYSSLPLDANGAMVRQIQVRLAPIVAQNGTANVQVSFRAQAPRSGKAASGAQCPEVVAHSEVLHFSMPTNGTAKTLTLSDGTQLSVSAQR